MKNPGKAYHKNGVTISHFPAIHARDGAISYKLEWNGRSMVFTGDAKPNDYVLKNAKGVDILIHEMTTTPEVWTTKQTGLTSGPIYDHYLEINKEVIENSHTVQGAYGYILGQTNPKLGVATHFPNDPDLIQPGLDAMSCSGYPRGKCVIAQDLTAITIDPDGNITPAMADVCGSCDEFPWFTGAPLAGPLAPPKYDGPLVQFNRKLLENVIPEEDYDTCNI